MVAEKILLKDFGGVTVQFEHGGVERQHVFGRDVSRRRRGLSRNWRHIGRKALGIRHPATATQDRDSHPAAKAFHISAPLAFGASSGISGCSNVFVNDHPARAAGNRPRAHSLISNVFSR